MIIIIIHAKYNVFLYRFYNIEFVRCMIQQGVERIPLW